MTGKGVLVMILRCNFCLKSLKTYKIWYLENIKNFTNRKLFIFKCPTCKTLTVVLKETRAEDGKVFTDKIKNDNEMLKVIYREKKRLIKEEISSDLNTVNGWLYGTNVEIKNRKGKVVQIRQYSTTFGGDKQLVKKIMVK